MTLHPTTAERILQATYLQVIPVCPDCGHLFTDASLPEIEAHILAAHTSPDADRLAQAAPQLYELLRQLVATAGYRLEQTPRLQALHDAARQLLAELQQP